MEEPGEMSPGSFLLHDTFTHTLTIVIPDVAQRRSGTGEPPTRGCNRLASISKRSCLPDPARASLGREDDVRLVTELLGKRPTISRVRRGPGTASPYPTEGLNLSRPETNRSQRV